MYVRAFDCLCLFGPAEIDKHHILLFFVDKNIQLVSLVDRLKLSSLNNKEDKYLFKIDDSMR